MARYMVSCLAFLLLKPASHIIYASAGRMAPARGCDSSRNSNQIATIVRNMNETVYNRMATFWPSNKGDNNW